jgi:hypothetical protein
MSETAELSKLFVAEDGQLSVLFGNVRLVISSIASPILMPDVVCFVMSE